MPHKSLPIIGVAAILVASLFVVSGCGKTETDSNSGHNNEVVANAHSHDVEGETCFICDETKREKGRLWCTEHARYEDRCWLCQPQLEDKSRLYCKEHSLYEDECFLCHPEVSDDNEESHLDAPKDE